MSAVLDSKNEYFAKNALLPLKHNVTKGRTLLGKYVEEGTIYHETLVLRE